MILSRNILVIFNLLSLINASYGLINKTTLMPELSILAIVINLFCLYVLLIVGGKRWD